MKKFTIHLQETCSREAFQMWVNAKKDEDNKLLVVAVRAQAPCQIEIDVEDRGEPA